MDAFKDFIQYVPIATVLLIILGTIKLSKYYEVFHIDITRYVTIPEITKYLIYTVRKIFLNSFILVPFFILILPFEKYFARPFWIPLLVCIPFAVTAIILYLKKITNKRLHVFHIIIAVGFFFGKLTFDGCPFFSNDSIVVLIFNYGATSIFLWLFVNSIAKNEIYQVRDQKIYCGVSIVLKDNTTIKSDEENYYIGNTEKFLFFYHQKEKTTEVIKMDNVNKVDFKE